MKTQEAIDAVVDKLKEVNRPVAFKFEDLADRAEIDAELLNQPAVRGKVRKALWAVYRHTQLVASGYFEDDDIEAQIRKATDVLTLQSRGDAQQAKGIIMKSLAIGHPAVGFRTLGLDGMKDDGLCLRELMVKQHVIRGFIEAARSSVKALVARKSISAENAGLLDSGLGGSALILARDLGTFTWPETEREHRTPAVWDLTPKPERVSALLKEFGLRARDKDRAMMMHRNGAPLSAIDIAMLGDRAPVRADTGKPDGRFSWTLLPALGIDPRRSARPHGEAA